MSGRSQATTAAIDLGASSGRVVVGACSADGVTLREVHRFANVPVRAGGTLRWDVLALFRGILDGLRMAAAAAAGPLDSVGVDSWGVDYGLLDADGQLLGNPAHYRDPRTGPAFSSTLGKLGAAELYRATGTALHPFNTVFQMLADRGSAQQAIAAHALLIPDLMTYWLCGSMGTELTNASTTGLLDVRTLGWSAALASRLELPVGLFAPIGRPGNIIGRTLPDVMTDAGLDAAPQVVTVPSHDTAAAVAGIPAGSDTFGYVSSGTWALVGLKLPEPVITEASRAANFTNEVGADGSTRFLRNVTCFWLLQECVREWRARGLGPDVGELTRAVAEMPALRAVVDVQEPAFAAPGEMPHRIAQACLRTSGVSISTPAEITRCILDSTALAIRHAIHDGMRLSGVTVDVVHVVGGGVSNVLFCQLVADACRLPVIAGPIEAAAWGNTIYQARALGVISGSAADARTIIRQAEEPVAYAVRGGDAAWQRADELVLQARGAG
ncbi:MAG TPA: FGGY-family carbohydrate kinase [Streptosporangiaceae bacterium]|jgi:rhamnulokinase|nr:FGGY-family carbohydrate kinase [Streptosporangiaceae bacterium]